MLKLQETCTLKDFQKQTEKHLRRLKRTGKPAVLTQNGHAEAVIQSAEGYEALLAMAELGDSVRILAKRLTEDPKKDISAEKVLRDVRKRLIAGTGR